MIRRARIKFVAFIMSIVFVILAVSFAVFSIISFNSKNKEILDNLNKVELSFATNRGPVTFDYIVCELDGDKIKSVIAKSENFPDELAHAIVDSSMSHAYATGSYDAYYYKISTNNEKDFIVIADMSLTLLRYRDTTLKLLFTLLGAFTLLFVLVWFISKSFFKPIQDTLNSQKKFLSDASHELKTPIAVISANADVIRSSEETEWINNIKSQTERMKTLVTDLLTLSAIDENRSVQKKARFNLSEEVIKVTLFFDALAFEKGKRIITNVDKDIFINGDAESVRKITEILIDNAIKYATKGTDIIVSLKKVAHKSVSAKYVLSVYNKGCNVPKEDIKKIFERFYRGEKSRSRELGGSGLGLSIAKSLANLNKWKISASCELNEFMEIKIII